MNRRSFLTGLAAAIVAVAVEPVRRVQALLARPYEPPVVVMNPQEYELARRTYDDMLGRGFITRERAQLLKWPDGAFTIENLAQGEAVKPFKRPPLLKWPDGARVPILRFNGTKFVSDWAIRGKANT